MATHIIKGILIERSTPLNLNELSQALHVQAEIIIEMVEHHLLEPQGRSPENWQFDDICFKRARIATSFHRDLEVNLQGVALALDLLEKIEQLEQHIQTLKQFEK